MRSNAANTTTRTIGRALAMRLHLELARSGKYSQARSILWMLRNGYVTLWNSDSDWELSTLLEERGFVNHQSSTGMSASYYPRII
jgi:hypothetical protein